MPPLVNEMTEIQLLEYRTRVKAAVKLRDGTVIYNGSIEHAQSIMEALFGGANKTVDILCEGLNQFVFGNNETIDAAEDFLDRGGKIRVLVEDQLDGGMESNRFFNAIRDDQNVEIRTVPQSLVDLYSYNFTVADDDMYRFEKNRRYKAAAAKFGAPDGGVQKLSEIFNTLWTPSSPINATQITA